VLDILVAQVVLQRAGILAIIRQLEAAGVAQHVRMDGKWQPNTDRNIRRELRRLFFFLDLLEGT
jgi:hypothetical protein